MNRIVRHFQAKPQNTLNIFCTAGYPGLTDIVPIVEALQDAGADMVEIGMPFSDPTADGPTIQYSNKIALDNGMQLKELFEQLQGLRERGTYSSLIDGLSESRYPVWVLRDFSFNVPIAALMVSLFPTCLFMSMSRCIDNHLKHTIYPISFWLRLKPMLTGSAK